MISILSNIPELPEHGRDAEVSIGFEAHWGLRGQLKSGFSTVRKALRHDAVLLSNPNPSMMVTAILIRILSLGKVRLYFYDVLLATTRKGLGARLRSAVRVLASRLAERIFLVHLDYETYAHELGADPARLEFVGFKCNNHERLDGIPRGSPRGDYVLACGQSYRDYPTFLRAMGKLGIPAVVLLAPRSDLELHGSWFGGVTVPENVVVMEHDGRVETWDRFLRGASLVVLPLRKDVIQPAGISVCLEAMAWGKAVVLSEGPLTCGGLIAPPAAEVFPAGDADALARTVDRLWKDHQARAGLAEEGAALAQRFGGVRRMCESLIGAVVASRQKSENGTRKGALARLSRKRAGS